eukprot:m.57036 g.57036  ORF g.57036 m.57036 type:complete len:355 (-) comp13047_c0_seq1:188-1252(-)
MDTQTRENSTLLCKKLRSVMLHGHGSQIHCVRPCTEPLCHGLDLIHIQHTWLHPVQNGNIIHLVKSAPYKTKRECLHHQQLHLVNWGLCGLANVGKGNSAIVGWSAENHLHQGQESDFFLHDMLVGLQIRIGTPLWCQELKLGQIAAIKSIKKVNEPLLFRRSQALQNLVREQFTKVVHALAQDGSESKIKSTLYLLVHWKLVQIDATKEAKGVLVEFVENRLTLEVLCRDTIKIGVHFCNTRELVQQRLGFLQLCLGFICVVEVKLELSHGCDDTHLCKRVLCHPLIYLSEKCQRCFRAFALCSNDKTQFCIRQEIHPVVEMNDEFVMKLHHSPGLESAVTQHAAELHRQLMP